MGLDAFVRCRCWEDGTYHPPPPIPAERIGVVDGSLEPLVDGEWRDFDRWKRTACAHPDMDAACVLAELTYFDALPDVGTETVLLDEGSGEVETRLVSPAEFAYVVEPLRRVCQVSVETGNPVVWC